MRTRYSPGELVGTVECVAFSCAYFVNCHQFVHAITHVQSIPRNFKRIRTTNTQIFLWLSEWIIFTRTAEPNAPLHMMCAMQCVAIIACSQCKYELLLAIKQHFSLFLFLSTQLRCNAFQQKKNTDLYHRIMFVLICELCNPLRKKAMPSQKMPLRNVYFVFIFCVRRICPTLYLS